MNLAKGVLAAVVLLATVQAEAASEPHPLKSPKNGLVLAVNTGAGKVVQEGVKTVGNLNRYTATVRTPVAIVINGNVDRAPQGYVETDVIRVRQNDRIVGYAIHAIRLNIKK